MLNKTVTIQQVFDSFNETHNIITKSYKYNCDDTMKEDIVFDFRNEFFRILEYYIKTDDWLDLVEEFQVYIDKKEGV